MALPAFGLTVSVAPKRVASCSFSGGRSTAMIRDAPAMAAPLMAARPTPPQPMTATVEPGSTWAEWKTEPTPVMTPQPIRQARSSGMSLSIAQSAFSWTRICSAKEERFRNWPTFSLPMDRRGASSGRRLNWSPFTVWQTDIWPVRQYSQTPQKGERIEMTWSPGFTAETIEPTCSTTPALSWPRMTGISVGKFPSQKWTSEWQTPMALRRTSTSRGPGLEMVTSSIDRGLFASRITAAFMAVSSGSVLTSIAQGLAFDQIDARGGNEAWLSGHRVESGAGWVIGRKQKLEAQVADGHVFAGSEMHDCGQEAELAVRQVDDQRHERAALKAAGQRMALARRIKRVEE